jgi:hypothetical protein
MGVGTHRSIIAVAVLVLLLGGGAVVSLGTASFRDPVGDVKGGAGPDLAAISVSHTTKTITFRLRFAKAPPLGANAGKWVDVLLIGIDVPPRGPKSGPHGWTSPDYYAGLHGTDKTAVLLKTPTTQSGQGKVLARPKVVVAGRTLGFTISRSALGDPPWFEFAVAVGRETASQAPKGGTDEAPAHGTFHYKLGSSLPTAAPGEGTPSPAPV